MKEPYLYILMRTDLPSMGAGRAAAQASHAASAFAKKYGHTKEYKEWAGETTQGFGTAIVLGVTNDPMGEIHKAAFHQKFATEQIVDPDYAIVISSEVAQFLNKNLSGIKIESSEKDPTKVIIHRQEITCAYVFGEKEKLSELLGGLPLYS